MESKDNKLTKFITMFKKKKTPSANDTMTSNTSLKMTMRPHIAKFSLANDLSKPKNKSRVGRTARVFLSSPFQGMEKERDILTKKYFPMLRALCEKEGTLFHSVDLRWGVTAKAAEEGQTLKICLQEIDESDLFVGLYGSRYGWHNTQSDLRLLSTFSKASEKYPWVDSFEDRSVTEIEYRHAFLNTPGEMPSFFYFRDPAYDQKMHSELSAKNLESAKGYSCESPEAEEKLQSLKKEVEATTGAKACETYSDPEQGAEKIYTHLKAFLENSFSKGRRVSDLEKYYREHVSFLKSKSSSDSFVGGDDYLKQLDNYADGTTVDPPLLITGPPGCGKTRLICHWMEQRVFNHPEELMLFHFVGANPESTQYSNILYRLVSHLQKELNAKGYSPSPNQASELVRNLRSLLTMANHNEKRVVIILDGLDQLLRTTVLSWLPEKLPANCRLILSLAEDFEKPISKSFYDYLINEKKATLVKVLPFDNKSKEQYIQKSLAKKGKELSKEQLSDIVSHKSSSNPLFLSVLLEELCHHGDFFTLDKKIQSYLQLPSITELYLKAFERLEVDCESYLETQNVKNVIKSIMSVIYASQYGLSDQEIMDVINIDGTSWSTLSLVLSDYISNRGGLMQFSNDHVKFAVEKRYFTDSQNLHDFQVYLLDYFQRQLDEKLNLFRVAEELPNALLKLKEFDRLKNALVDQRLFRILCDNWKNETINFWKECQATQEEIEQYYLKIVDTAPADQFQDSVNSIITFLGNAAYYVPLNGFINKAIEKQEKISIISNFYCELLNYLATNLVDQGKYDDALVVHKRALEVEEKAINESAEKDPENHSKLLEGRARTLSNIGVVYYRKKNFADAEKMYTQSLKEVISLCGESDRKVADGLNNIGILHFESQKWEEAEKCLKRSLELYSDIFLTEPNSDMGGTQLNLAIVYRNMGKLTEAESLYYKSLETREKAVGKGHPDYAQSMNGLALFFMNGKKDPERAYPYFLANIELYRSLLGSGHIELAKTLENTTICALRMLDITPRNKSLVADCDRHEKEAIKIFKENNFLHISNPAICKAIANQYRLVGDFEKALEWVDIMVNDFGSLKMIDSADMDDYNKYKALDHVFKNRNEEALKILRNGDHQPVFYSSFYQSVASYHRDKSQLNIGYECLKEALKRFPNDPIFLFNIGHCCSILEDWKSSKQYFSSLIAVEPNDIDALISLAEAKIKLGEKDLTELTQATNLMDPNDERHDKIISLRSEARKMK